MADVHRSPPTSHAPDDSSLYSPAVNDRIFSTVVDCSYTISLPPSALSPKPNALASLSLDFDTVYNNVERTTLETFAEHDSASVQATLYQMCETILKDNVSVSEVSYKLPNKVSGRVKKAPTLLLLFLSLMWWTFDSHSFLSFLCPFVDLGFFFLVSGGRETALFRG